MRIPSLLLCFAFSLGACGFSASSVNDSPGSLEGAHQEIAAGDAMAERPGGFVGSTTDNSEIDPGANCKADGSNCTKSTASDQPTADPASPTEPQTFAQAPGLGRPLNPGPPPKSSLKLCPPGWKNVSKVYVTLNPGDDFALTCFHAHKGTATDYLDNLTQPPWPASGYVMAENACMQLNEDGSVYKDPQSSYEGGMIGFYYSPSDYQFSDSPVTLTPELLQKLVEGLKANQVKVSPLLLAPKNGTHIPPENCP